MTWNKTGNIQGPPGGSGITFQPVKTSGYTFVLGDANKCTPFDLSISSNATIPTNANVAFPIGTELSVRQVGNYVVNLVGESSVVTLRIPNGAATSGQGDYRMAVKYAADIWDIL